MNFSNFYKASLSNDNILEQLQLVLGEIEIQYSQKRAQCLMEIAKIQIALGKLKNAIEAHFSNFLGDPNIK